MDAAVAALAKRQHGLISAAQCLSLGATREWITVRLEAGRWHEVHRGVYAIGHAPLTHHARYRAATLATGGVLSHRNAASLWGLQPHHGGPVHVLSETKKHPRRGIVTHWTRNAPAATTRQGIPVTSLIRTLEDLGRIAPPDEHELAIRAAERMHGLKRTSLERRPDVILTRGHLERRFLRILDDAGLQRPAMNHPWNGFELDGYWPDLGLVLEIDDVETHLNRASFTSDRRRDRALTVAGLRPIRIT